MKRVQDDEEHEHVEMTTEEARQGYEVRPPIFYVLLAGTLAAFFILWVIYAVYF